MRSAGWRIRLLVSGTGSHDTFFVSWAFPSATIRIRQLDIFNLDWASAGCMLVEKNPRHQKRVVATRLREDPETMCHCECQSLKNPDQYDLEESCLETEPSGVFDSVRN